MKSWLFDFLMNKFQILTCFGELWFLTLDFDQKVKVWLFSIQLTFDQLTENQLSTKWPWTMFWVMPLGQNYAIELLGSCFKPINHLLGQKIRNCPFLVKTLILTILPFWRFDQISWGIVVQTWSNDTHEFIMLIWINNYEFLL